MKKALPLYLKYFLLTGMVYVIYTIPRNLVTEREITLTDSVSSFLIFGIAMSVILVSYHIYTMKDLAKRNNIDLNGFDSKQASEVNSAIEPSNLYERLGKFRDFDKTSHDERQNTIIVKTGFRGKSWGDRISISYQESKGAYIYKISSKPRFFVTMIDFGQNLENVLQIKKMLQPASPL